MWEYFTGKSGMPPCTDVNSTYMSILDVCIFFGDPRICWAYIWTKHFKTIGSFLSEGHKIIPMVIKCMVLADYTWKSLPLDARDHALRRPRKCRLLCHLELRPWFVCVRRPALTAWAALKPRRDPLVKWDHQWSYPVLNR